MTLLLETVFTYRASLCRGWSQAGRTGESALSAILGPRGAPPALSLHELCMHVKCKSPGPCTTCTTRTSHATERSAPRDHPRSVFWIWKRGDKRFAQSESSAIGAELA